MEHHPNEVRPSVNVLLTDLYQITMAYSYFKQGRHNAPAVFDAFFRKPPFKGKFTILGGVKDVVNFVRTFKFKPEHIEYLRNHYPHWSTDFFTYLESLDGSHIQVYTIKEGTIVFPKAPVVQFVGPLGFLQLLETTILNLMNFPTLIATNARRMKIAAEKDSTLIEFGLRRAQGPDGAMMASEYSYLGGFHGTSNVAAGKAFGIPIYGTMAHAFICAYRSLDEVTHHEVDGKDLKAMAVQVRKEMGCENTNEGEFASFIAYACDHPDGFLALVDTYNTLYSGIPNFLAVAIALVRIGRKPRGIRLDSGDLSQLSKDSRKYIDEQAAKFNVDLSDIVIFASNELNEPTLLDLKAKGHSINAFGIGTNLVTCQAQPALGMVYKLVDIEGHDTIKFSEEIEKLPIPGKKKLYRLYAKKDGYPVCDLMAAHDEKIEVGETIHLRDTGDLRVRFTIKPEKVESLYELIWDGKTLAKQFDLHEARDHCEKQVESFKPSVLSLSKPETYPVYVTQKMCEATLKVMEENIIWKEIKE